MSGGYALNRRIGCKGTKMFQCRQGCGHIVSQKLAVTGHKDAANRLCDYEKPLKCSKCFQPFSSEGKCCKTRCRMIIDNRECGKTKRLDEKICVYCKLSKIKKANTLNNPVSLLRMTRKEIVKLGTLNYANLCKMSKDKQFLIKHKFFISGNVS